LLVCKKDISLQNENSNKDDKNMKKLALFLGLVLAGALSSGQAPHVPQLDTLWGKESTYFYPPYFWYDLDTCHLPFWYHQFFGDAIDQNLAWK